MLGKAQHRLPDDGNGVWLELAIDTDKPCLFGLCLGNQQTVERIMMVER